MNFVFPPPPRATLPVRGRETLFPVNRIFCVGRNYAAHAREMGHDPNREPPFFFQKNPDCLVTDGAFRLPPHAGEVHHEIELAVALHAGGRNVAPDAARAMIFGYGVALDMTRRDLQAELKRLGRPWEVAKAFPFSAPCSAIAPAADVGHPDRGTITLDINGTRRQTGDLADMIWSVPELLAELSRHFDLSSGDLVLTGTPDGVGPVRRSDQLTGSVAGIGDLHVTVV